MTRSNAVTAITDFLGRVNGTNGIKILGYFPLAEALANEGYRREESAAESPWRKADDLPEECGVYYVAVFLPEYDTVHYTTTYYSKFDEAEKGCGWTMSSPEHRITHWMPIPALPE